MPIRSRMNSIMGHIEPEHPELFALEFGKIAETDFVYTLSSTNFDQSAPNLVKMYVTIRSWMNLIMDLSGPELSELSALELENLPYLTLCLHSSICKYWPANTKLGHSTVETRYNAVLGIHRSDLQYVRVDRYNAVSPPHEWPVPAVDRLIP